MDSDSGQAQRRTRIRITAILFSLVAFGFYGGFIFMMYLRGH